MSDPTNPTAEGQGAGAPTTPAQPATSRQQALPLAQQPAANGPAAVIPPAILAELDRARAEAAQLAAQLKARDAAESETKATLAKLNEQVTLSAKEREDLAAARKADAVRAAARMAAIKAGAVNETQVVKLVLDELVATDDGKVVHAKDPAVDADTFVAKFLAENAHLAAPRVARGSGASPFPAAAPAGGPPPDLTSAEGMTAYARSLTFSRPASANGKPGT